MHNLTSFSKDLVAGLCDVGEDHLLGAGAQHSAGQVVEGVHHVHLVLAAVPGGLHALVVGPAGGGGDQVQDAGDGASGQLGQTWPTHSTKGHVETSPGLSQRVNAAAASHLL